MVKKVIAIIIIAGATFFAGTAKAERVPIWQYIYPLDCYFETIYDGSGKPHYSITPEQCFEEPILDDIVDDIVDQQPYTPAPIWVKRYWSIVSDTRQEITPPEEQKPMPVEEPKKITESEGEPQNIDYVVAKFSILGLLVALIVVAILRQSIVALWRKIRKKIWHDDENPPSPPAIPGQFKD